MNEEYGAIDVGDDILRVDQLEVIEDTGHQEHARDEEVHQKLRNPHQRRLIGDHIVHVGKAAVQHQRADIILAGEDAGRGGTGAKADNIDAFRWIAFTHHIIEGAADIALDVGQGPPFTLRLASAPKVEEEDIVAFRHQVVRQVQRIDVIVEAVLEAAVNDDDSVIAVSGQIPAPQHHGVIAAVERDVFVGKADGSWGDVFVEGEAGDFHSFMGTEYRQADIDHQDSGDDDGDDFY